MQAATELKSRQKIGRSPPDVAAIHVVLQSGWFVEVLIALATIRANPDPQKLGQLAFDRWCHQHRWDRESTHAANSSPERWLIVVGVKESIHDHGDPTGIRGTALEPLALGQALHEVRDQLDREAA